MKKISALFYLMLFTALLSVTTGYSQVDVSTGGPTTPYTDLKSAFDAINAGTHTGAITIGISGNTTETASAVLNASGTGLASYTSIVISPSGGSPRTISGSFTGHLIDLNGADNVTINGLNTGGNSLTISSTAIASSSTIRLYGDATGNTVTNCTLLGGSTTFGVVYFGDGVASGNDNNTVSYCNIGPAAGVFPLNGIYSLGTSAVIDNNTNTVTNNNIYDYFSAGSASSGMNINSGNTAWTISNNRFYQTASRTYTTGSTHNGIAVTSGAGYTITGNTIGYADSEGSGTYTMLGSVTNRFIGISLAVGTTTAVTSVQGNTITAISIATTSGANTTYGVLCGVSVTAGNVNIGDITRNVFGGSSGVDLLKATPTTTQGMIVGINISSTGTILIKDNVMGGFSSSGTTATIAGGVSGINVSGIPTLLTITGNTIGNTTANNMRGGTSGLTTGASVVMGIWLPSTPTATIITGNTIQNMISIGTTSGGFVRGIWTASSSAVTSPYTITGNTINNLSTNAPNVSISNGNAGAVGINLGTGGNSLISGNNIYNIDQTNAGTGGYMAAGITHANATNTTISNNVIYGITNASTSVSTTAPGIAAGIIIRSGTTAITCVNNMISLGRGQATNTSFIGIHANHGSSPDPVDKLYHNTLNIEGTAASGAEPSFGFYRGDFSATARTATVDVRNNIINNTRSGGTGKHFAISNNYGATTASATGWPANASNYNVLNATASTIGYWTTDKTFADWKTISASDLNSLSAIPVTFNNSGQADLHLNMGATPTQLESGCLVIAAAATDFDGQARPGPAGSVNGGGTLPDFGADEFDGAPLDLIAPAISYTPLLNTASTSARTLVVTVTDLSGVPTTAPGWPNLYWKKTGDPGYTAVTPVSIAGSQYTFSFGAGVSLGDVVYYYVAAQDNAPAKNVSVFPSAGAAGFTPDPPAASTPPTTPSSYNVGGIAGVFHVGVGLSSPDYPTITAAIADLNSKEMTGAVTFILDDATYSASETFPLVINQNLGASASNPLKIYPKTGITTTISGAAASAALILVKCNYTTIDGSNSGSSTRDMTITNTSATTPQVIRIGSTGTTPLTNVTIQNCNIINGVSSSSALVVYGADGTAGYFNNITIQNNSVQKAYIGIYCLATIAAGNGSGLLITGNNLDISGANANRLIGVYVQGVDGATVTNNYIGNMPDANAEINRGIWFATGTVNSAISGNTIYNLSYTGTGAFGPMGISISSAVASANVSVTGNTITGLTSSGSSVTYGLYAFSTTSGVTIQKNRISNIKNTNTGGYSALGIALASSLPAADFTIRNNFIWDVAGYGWNSVLQDNGYGIFINSGGGYKLYDNSVSLSTNQTLTTGVPACLFIGSTVLAGGLDVQNNIFSIDATVGTDRYAINCNAPANVFSVIDNNDYFSSGPNLGYLGANVLNLAAWKTASGKDVHSVSGDPKFVSPTDLHILSGVYSPVRSAGVSIASVPDDIDGITRSNPPDIGAAEDGYAPVAISGVAVNITCNGSANGSITTTAVGGLGPYTYLWSNAATTANQSGLTAGSYLVTVTDALSVSGTGSWTITEPAAFYLYTEVTAASCPTANDGSISLAINGGTPAYTHLWSNLATTEDISGLAPGVYTVTVTDNAGCVTTGSWTVGQASTVCANTGVTGEVSGTACYNATNTITVAGGASLFTVVAPNGNATFIAGVNILFMPGTSVQSGAYMHGYISTTYCTNPSTPIVAAGTGAEYPQPGLSNANFSLYPNPTNGNFTLVQRGSKSYETVRVEIYNMTGDRMMTETVIGEKSHEFRISAMPAGLYFVKVVAGDYVETIKLIRTR